MSIIRIKHNKENPFVQLNKKGLWDEDLSLKATGLWARCLSRPDNWTFNISEMIKSSKEGKRAIYSAIDELIAHGYVVRVQVSIRNDTGQYGFQKVEYHFFEFKLSGEETEKYKEEFKKSLPRCGFAHARFSLPQNEPLIRKKEKEKEFTKKESKPKKKPPSYEQPPNPEANASLDSKESHDTDSISPEISKIVGLLKRSLKDLKHDYKIKPTDEARWAREIEKMIRIDERNPEIIKKILEWLPTDSFWQGVILSGAKLRKQFDALEIEMHKSRNKANQEKYKTFAYKVKKARSNCPLIISNKGVYDKINGVELSFAMPYEDFCHTLARKYNATNYEGDM